MGVGALVHPAEHVRGVCVGRDVCGEGCVCMLGEGCVHVGGGVCVHVGGGVCVHVGGGVCACWGRDCVSVVQYVSSIQKVGVCG